MSRIHSQLHAQSYQTWFLESTFASLALCLEKEKKINRETLPHPQWKLMGISLLLSILLRNLWTTESVYLTSCEFSTQGLILKVRGITWKLWAYLYSVTTQNQPSQPHLSKRERPLLNKVNIFLFLPFPSHKHTLAYFIPAQSRCTANVSRVWSY